MSWTYEDFKKGFFDLTNINLTLYKERQMKRRIDALISRVGFEGYKEYFEELKSKTGSLDNFIDYLTINVSEFYRNPEQWQVLEDQVIAPCIKKKGNIKVWSASCSTGEEPYSLVMLLSKFLPINSIKILATDLDAAALNKAKVGIYHEKSLEALPQKFIQDFFKNDGSSFVISEDIKKCVEFRQHDLLREEFPGKFDLIVCRNVMIYFTEEAKEVLYKNFHDSLDKDGILFVGSTEQIIFPQRYSLKPLRTYFYKRADS